MSIYPEIKFNWSGLVCLILSVLLQNNLVNKKRFAIKLQYASMLITLLHMLLTSQCNNIPKYQKQ